MGRGDCSSEDPFADVVSTVEYRLVVLLRKVKVVDDRLGCVSDSVFHHRQLYFTWWGNVETGELCVHNLRSQAYLSYARKGSAKILTQHRTVLDEVDLLTIIFNYSMI